MFSKISFGVFILLLAASSAFAQNYKITDVGSSVAFTIENNMVISTTVNGKFSGLKGTATFDLQHLAQAHIQASVNTNTVSTGIGMRDNHLKKAEYFNAAKYPVIEIKSTAIKASTQPGTYIFEGTLHMKGTSKNISFPFTVKSLANGFLLHGSFKLKRSDYNIGTNNNIADDLIVKISASLLPL